jgi:hypothetical protein
VAINLHIDLRPEQRRLFDERERFAVRVCHRRFGKTFQAVAELLIGALSTYVKDWRGYYVGPSYKQTKRLAWDYLKSFVVAVPGTQINEQELRVDFPNGSRIQLLGAETYDSLRGMYADDVVLDECQLIPSVAYSQVIRPMLADRLGRMTVQGTPAGRHNLLFDLLTYAQKGDPGWSYHVMPVTQTDIINKDELRAMQREMPEAEYQQEMHCSFNAAIVGAYFAKEMQRASDQGRISKVKYDSAAKLYAALDLGWSDLMVVNFIQPVGTEHHFIKTVAYAETKIADMVNDWKNHVPTSVDTVILPHDATQHNLETGRSREDVFKAMGLDTVVTPRVGDKHEGIAATRDLLGHCWFDAEGCQTLVEALFSYRAEYDDTKRVMKMRPVHDWSSHYADAVQTYALGRPSNDYMNWADYPSVPNFSRRVRV